MMRALAPPREVWGPLRVWCLGFCPRPGYPSPGQVSWRRIAPRPGWCRHFGPQCIALVELLRGLDHQGWLVLCDPPPGRPRPGAPCPARGEHPWLGTMPPGTQPGWAGTSSGRSPEVAAPSSTSRSRPG